MLFALWDRFKVHNAKMLNWTKNFEKKREGRLKARMICFLVFTALYYTIAISVLVYNEHKLKESLKNVDRARTKSLDRAISVTNFGNAVIATILSSVSLYVLDGWQRTDINVGRPSQLAEWTVESVCGYIVVEITFISVNSFRLSERSWIMIRHALQETILFHAVALTGLVSVLIFNAGYAIALWVIWSELTSVFLGIEEWMEHSHTHIYYPRTYSVVKATTSFLFVFQRVLVFLYLLWLCWSQFTWQLLFIVQLSILCIGTLLNVLFAIERFSESNTTDRIISIATRFINKRKVQ